MPLPSAGPARGAAGPPARRHDGRTFLRHRTPHGPGRCGGPAAGLARVQRFRLRRHVLRALAVAALHGHRLRRVLRRGGRRVALPRGSGHPGLAAARLTPGSGRLERHSPRRAEQFVGPRQTHSA
ncbi:hypothetical protein STXM2123_4780 [Streptomyces sp. F-3]|nr:hypothetical protein STXM2123_4780 [Streptomyces sp. F-3]